MSMREKLGRALSSAALCRPDFDDPRTTDDNGINIITGRELGLEMADVALDTLMYESNGMSGAMIQAGIDANEVPPSGSVCAIFWAMIRAAKEEK